ncbi:MAG TPA: sigma 54-interacting transcriptional regulator [Polyangia bacterium]|nr:sigma 54-interacting transcriptional regulator [Polyangia bacterium]
MAEPRDQTLTQVQSPLSPGEQRDRAVMLVSGNATTPGLPARARLQIVGDELYLGRRADGLPVQASVAVLDDALVSGQHARLVRGSGGYDLEDLGSKNGTFVDNVRAEGRVRLRDGALVFVGNHVGVFRMVSQIELEAIKAELVSPLGPVATASPALAVACDRLRRLAASEGELFIVGETGVGKEVYARAVHDASQRKGKFVAINCAAIPRELVESELFGYRAGAHSTAHQAKAGLIEEAEGGTLFLDEIGEMTPEAQIKILRFLQDRELTPLGATRPRRMDVRIIAATNRTVAGPGKSGLRDDIVARLGAAPIHLPPLRNRIEDLGALIGHFLGGVPAQGPRFEQPAFRALSIHAWPLNVRELEKIVTTAAVLTGGKPIALRDLPEPIARVLSAPVAAGVRRSTGPSPTPAQLEELLRRYEGNVADVSRELGKHRAAVWRWIKKFGLGPQKFRRTDTDVH